MSKTVTEYPPGVELEDRACPLGCQRFDTLVLKGWDRIHGTAGLFEVVRCNGCGLMRTNPRPTPATIGAYYPDDYGPYASSKPSRGTAPSWKQSLRGWIGLESRKVPKIPPGKLLEIGCASGSYLQQMRQRGWQVQGIEFSDTAARQAREAGFDVQTASIESARSPEQLFDLVAAWMVLEHLHDPVGALRRIRSWVKPDGYLIASIPVHGKLFVRLFGDACYDLHLPNHLYHFSPSTVRRLLQHAGWRVERIAWQRNPSALLSTLKYVLNDRGLSKLAALVNWVGASSAAAVIRFPLGWLLALARSTGRVEIWARPTPAEIAR